MSSKDKYKRNSSRKQQFKNKLKKSLMATFEELSSEDEAEEEEEANLALMASADSDIESDDEPEPDSEKTDEVFADCTKSQLITALNKVIEKYLKVSKKHKQIQKEFDTLEDKESHFRVLYQQTLARVTDLEKGCPICYKPRDEHEVALQQFVHLNVGKSKSASLVYNVCRFRGEGVGYEYGRTYSKSKSIRKKIGKSYIYYFVPQCDKEKVPNDSQEETTSLEGPETVDSDVPSSSDSGNCCSEDRSCSGSETIGSESLNTSESEKPEPNVRTKNNESKNLKHLESRVTQLMEQTPSKNKVTNLRPQKHKRSQVIYDSRTRSYNLPEQRNGRQHRFLNHKQTESWRRNNHKSKQSFQNNDYYNPKALSKAQHNKKPFRTNNIGPRSKWVPKSEILYHSDLSGVDNLLSNKWMKAICKGRKAYVPRKWFIRTTHSQNIREDDDDYWDEYIANCDRDD